MRGSVSAMCHQPHQKGVLSPNEAGFPLQLLHESGGSKSVAAMLSLLERGKGARLWSWLQRLGAAEVLQPRPFLMEFDLVARSAFTELGYGIPHDPADGPLTSGAELARIADRYPPFAGEPFSIRTAAPYFDWPVLVLSGERDIRAPRITVEKVVATVSHATLLTVASQGHSTLDTAHVVAIDVIHRFTTPECGGATTEPNPPVASPSPVSRFLAARLMLARALPKGLS